MSAIKLLDLEQETPADKVRTIAGALKIGTLLIRDERGGLGFYRVDTATIAFLNSLAQAVEDTKYHADTG